jgi:hypothetical protein
MKEPIEQNKESDMPDFKLIEEAMNTLGCKNLLNKLHTAVNEKQLTNVRIEMYDAIFTAPTEVFIDKKSNEMNVDLWQRVCVESPLEIAKIKF